MEGSIAFKAFLYSDKIDSPLEVRWFYVEQNAIVSLENVKEKLKETFPCLKRSNYSVSWKDCDNDLITISSDAELLIALSNIRTDPRRLYIRLESELMDSPTQSNLFCEQTRNSSGNQNSTSGILHSGVICDSCNGDISGFRYKCIECPDFDLCSRCEMKQEHADHCFIRITDPAASSRLRKCLSHQLGKKLFKHSERETKPEGGRKHHKRHAHQRHGWFETLSKYMNDVNMAMAENNENENQNSTGNNENSRNNRGQGETSTGAPEMGRCPYFNNGAPSTNDKAKGDDDQNDLHVNYLKNIGQTIANLLDPLGIDVDIDVRTRNTPSSTQNMETENENITSNKPTEASKESPKEAPKSNTTESNVNSKPTTNESNVNLTANENITSQSSEFCNRAVPVFINTNSNPGVYTTCGTSSSTIQNNNNSKGAPIVSAFVNGTPMETENGWTLLDDINETSSSSASDNGNVSDNNQKKTESENQFNKPKETSNTNNGNGEQGNSTNNGIPTNSNNLGGGPQIPQPPLFGGFMGMGMPPMGIPVPTMGMPVPPMGIPVPPMGTPGQFNFDQMARELQKHIQTHFKGAMDAAQTAAAAAAAAQQTTAASSSNQKNQTQSQNPNNLGGNQTSHFTYRAWNTTEQNQNNPENKTGSNDDKTETNIGEKVSTGNINNASSDKISTGNISNDTNSSHTKSTGFVNVTSTGATPRKGAPVMTQRVYPSLSEQKQESQHIKQVKISTNENVVIGPSAPPRHRDESVNRGLETMLAMGFNNEGGWLTTVLECANGDVTKALDLLQPVKK